MTDNEFLAAIKSAHQQASCDPDDDFYYKTVARLDAIEAYLTAKIEAEKSDKGISLTVAQCAELAAIEPGTKRFRAIFTILNDQPATKKLMRDLADK